jgi:hypothetical protein
MRRGLPKAELRRLWHFYLDLGVQQGWLKIKEPGEEDLAPGELPQDWDADSLTGAPNK